MDIKTNTHHRKTLRLPGYDYSQSGAYFITVCSHQRLSLFGDVQNGCMVLNAEGMMVEQCWREIPRHFSDIELGEYVVMPNHFHGILVINNGRGTVCRAPTSRVEQFGKPVSGSIPTVIRSFKSAVTKHINQLSGKNDKPIWQRNYYEHIIRNERAYHHIAEYIHNNPLQWQEDTYFIPNES